MELERLGMATLTIPLTVCVLCVFIKSILALFEHTPKILHVYSPAKLNNTREKISAFANLL